jgi:3-deoxy-7-phosphoheptulonate synthase
MAEAMHQPINALRVARENVPEGEQTLVSVGSTVFGGRDVPLIAGPCAVESYEQLRAVAKVLAELGIRCMRGGAFKPRTSPYSFQGLGDEALRMLGEIRREFGLSIVSEVMGAAQIEQAEPFIDCFQVGARNMQNFELLRELGKARKPVLLKRGVAATLDEFLNAAEYIVAGGNSNVILCERGIRSFDLATRNVLDLAAVAVLKELSHLPVIVDPSHGTGRRSLIFPLSRAAIAVGADGLMIEVHPDPEQALSDAHQAITPDELIAMVPHFVTMAFAAGRSLILEPVGVA